MPCRRSSAGLDVGVEDPASLVLWRAPAPGVSERHRPESEALGDAEPASSEQLVSHHRLPSVPITSANRSAAPTAASGRGTVRVRARIALERDEARPPQAARDDGERSNGRGRSSRRLARLTDASAHETEDLYPLRIRQRATEGEQAVLGTAGACDPVHDQPRRPVLSQDERRLRLEVRHEHDALGLGLRDVPVPHGEALDRSQGRAGADRLRGDLRCALASLAASGPRSAPDPRRPRPPGESSFPPDRVSGAHSAKRLRGRRSSAGDRAAGSPRFDPPQRLTRDRRLRRACTTTTRSGRGRGGGALRGRASSALPGDGRCRTGGPASSATPKRLSQSPPSVSPTASSVVASSPGSRRAAVETRHSARREARMRSPTRSRSRPGGLGYVR